MCPLAFAELVLASAAVLADSANRPLGGDLASDLACRTAALLAPVYAALEARPAPPPVAADPPDPLGAELAADPWRHLAKSTPAQRALIVEHGREYQTEALLVRLCDESERAESDTAAEFLALAELAVKVAENAPGPPARRALRQGYALAFVANARRASNHLPAADSAMVRARLLFSEGGAEDPGLLDPARMLDREALLRRDQGRTAQALELYDQALKICRRENWARLLIHQAGAFEEADDPARAIETLRLALAATDGGEGGKRIAWLARAHLARTLFLAGRHEEASTMLPALRHEGGTLGGTLDHLRLRRLEAGVTAALGRTTEALAELSAVRREFSAIPSPTEAVLTGLEEVEILLREDRMGKARIHVRTLKSEVESLGLKREALEAYRHLLAAVERERATADMAHEAAKSIYRSGRCGGPAKRQAGLDHH